MNYLEVRRRNGEYPLKEIASIIREHGIVILKEVLPVSTRETLRATLERSLVNADEKKNVLRLPIYPTAEYLVGDLLSIRELEEFEYIFFRQELLNVLREILGSKELLYFGDSSVQYGEAARGFHKDNVDRSDGTKDDWNGEYGLVRCGFYCQDHVKHSGGLKIRLASHNIPTHTKGKIVDVRSSYGDVVVWNMRLTHSGNNRKLRLLENIPFHPRLEMICPAFLRAPEQMRRISAFCTFAKPGSHADRYIQNLDDRAKDYKDYLQRARKPEEAKPLLAKAGVTLRHPFEYYGELD